MTLNDMETFSTASLKYLFCNGSYLKKNRPLCNQIVLSKYSKFLPFYHTCCVFCKYLFGIYLPRIQVVNNRQQPSQ